MIAIDGVKQSTIRSHYQLGTLFYRLLWGPHIHHGLFDGDESAVVAQCRLTDSLADQVAFIDGFDTLLTAYRSGAMQYGAIVAEKIGESYKGEPMAVRPRATQNARPLTRRGS